MSDAQIGTFLQQCTQFDPASPEGLDLTTLYSDYDRWCRGAGHEPLSSVDFCIALRHQGVPHDDDRSAVRFYPGLSLTGQERSQTTPAEPTAVLPGSP
jgi:hypothetical protein